MFPICSPRFLPPRCAFNILGRSRLTFMLDIYSSGRTSRWRCFPLKALSGRKWGGGDGGGRWRVSERWWPLLIQRAATFLNSLSSSLPSHAAPAESKKTFSAPPRDRYVSSPRPCWSGEQMGAGEGGGGTQPQRRTLLSLLNSLNIVAAKQVTGTDWRQLTCPGRNPLNSLTPLSTHNASALHLTTRSYSQVSPSPPSP